MREIFQVDAGTGCKFQSCALVAASLLYVFMCELCLVTVVQQHTERVVKLQTSIPFFTNVKKIVIDSVRSERLQKKKVKTVAQACLLPESCRTVPPYVQHRRLSNF